MTDAFDLLIDPLLAEEGGYTNDPRDAGHETNWGVTVAVARANGYTGAMRDMTRAQASAIYRLRYWTGVGLDKVAMVSQSVAGELFDTGVNMGPVIAGTFLQRALNVLNRQGADWPDLHVDGSIGPTTVAALASLMKVRGPQGEKVMLKALNCLQGARYVELAEQRGASEAFEFGWLANRVGLAV